jgi:hypothetical protein
MNILPSCFLTDTDVVLLKVMLEQWCAAFLYQRSQFFLTTFLTLPQPVILIPIPSCFLGLSELVEIFSRI